MAKYRHKVTGVVRDYEESYARAIKALEPVSDEVQVTPLPCVPCGSVASAGVDVQTNEATPVADYAEPYEYELGE